MESHMYLLPRDGPSVFISPSDMDSPYTTPSLTANLVFRVLFGIISNLVCLVPLRLLYRNGEFAAVVFIVCVEIQNLRTIINALIWPTDDMGSWWPGYGLCDVDAYLHNGAIGLYATCLLTIMRNLALQLGSLRAHPLTHKEKRRRNLVQALIIFPLPIVQIALTFPLTAQRYRIGTLVGCTWNPYPAWPFLVFHVLAPAVVALITAAYAFITYIRFREVAKSTESALSSNRIASMRSQRTKCRLYLMVLSILTPFLPVVIGLVVGNILTMGPLKPFDYQAIHHPDETMMPWNSIVMVPSAQVTFVYMNNCYISILSAVPIFLFFGMTKDAMNCYRAVLLYMGFGKLFPCLHEEYNPDRRDFGSSSHNSSNYMTPTRASRKKGNSFTSSNQFNGFASSSTGGSSHQLEAQPLSFLSSVDADAVPSSTPELRRPPPSKAAFHNRDTPIQLPHRNPFLFRTRLNFPVPFSLSLFKTSNANTSPKPNPSLPLEPLNLGSQRDAHPEPLSHIQTTGLAWTDEESRLFTTPTTYPVLKYKSPSGCCGITNTIEHARLYKVTASQADGQQH